MKEKLLFTLFIALSSFAFSQVGIGTNTPDNSAMLEVVSTSKGILFPRMTSVQRTSIVSPAAGLHVFDITTNSLWFFNGTYWINYAAQSKLGDVKSGIQTSDHEGWILLDGRAISTLSPSQQVAAIALGLSGNLPNANNAYLVQNGSGMGTVSGSNSTTLTQANLPNVNFTGTAAGAGSHTHDVDPASVSTTTNGNHTHTTDPAAVTSSTNGFHSHAIGRRANQDNGAFDPGDAHAGEGSAATTDRAYLGEFYTGGSGNHNHTVDIPVTSTTTDGTHTHSVDVANTTSTTSGTHTHTVSVSSGGAATPINIAPKSLTVNMFIYLGL